MGSGILYGVNEVNVVTRTHASFEKIQWGSVDKWSERSERNDAHAYKGFKGVDLTVKRQKWVKIGGYRVNLGGYPFK